MGRLKWSDCEVGCHHDWSRDTPKGRASTFSLFFIFHVNHTAADDMTKIRDSSTKSSICTSIDHGIRSVLVCILRSLRTKLVDLDLGRRLQPRRWRKFTQRQLQVNRSDQESLGCKKMASYAYSRTASKLLQSGLHGMPC